MDNRLTERENFREKLEEKVKVQVPLNTPEQLDTKPEQFISDL